MHTPLSFEVVCLSTSKVWYRLHVYHLVGCLIVVIDQYLGLRYEHVVMMTTYIVNELFNVVLTVSVAFAFLSIATLTWILEEQVQEFGASLCGPGMTVKVCCTAL